MQSSQHQSVGVYNTAIHSSSHILMSYTYNLAVVYYSTLLIKTSSTAVIKKSKTKTKTYPGESCIVTGSCVILIPLHIRRHTEVLNSSTSIQRVLTLII